MTTVVVTGMHRSGTSMLAQMVDHLGVAMGERLYGATVNNLHGHYERPGFYGIPHAIAGRLLWT